MRKSNAGSIPTHGAVADRITVEAKKTSPSAIVHLWEPTNNRLLLSRKRGRWRPPPWKNASLA